jgi:hypothetical protein
MENLKIRSTYIPDNHLSQDEWYKELRISSAYVKPTHYYQGNELTFNQRSNTFSFLNFLKTLLWMN